MARAEWTDDCSKETGELNMRIDELEKMLRLAGERLGMESPLLENLPQHPTLTGQDDGTQSDLHLALVWIGMRVDACRMAAARIATVIANIRALAM